ncbi:MAG: DUF2927 domain-containing protein [Octadecabacter sp.]|nr:DUF2927 domain-containing protein [Octadecabacter sp.]
MPPSDLPERRGTAPPVALPAMVQFGAPEVSPPARSNAQMARDFLDLSFEMESGREIPTLSRFEGPITVAVRPGAPASLGLDLDQLLQRLRREAGIDIGRAPTGTEAASITIETLPRARMQRFVPQAACFVVPRVASWAEFRRARRGRTLDWTTLETRERVAIFIPSDVSPQEVRDCLHEEIAQAIGPLNDLYRLSDSVFNDDNMHAVLTGFDMLMLRAYYHPSLRSGLSHSDVAQRLPEILAELNPSGAGAGGPAVARTPRPWIEAIETALGGTSGPDFRRAAAARAIQIAQEAGLEDGRLAFSYFALGRLTLGSDLETAFAALRASVDLYDRIAPGGVQVAHLDMQMAAFALSAGRPDHALSLTGDAMRGATQGQNAALLSTILMIRAEALDALGRASEARETRLDSLAWGRYGFGGQLALGARLTEVAALSP